MEASQPVHVGNDIESGAGHGPAAAQQAEGQMLSSIAVNFGCSAALPCLGASPLPGHREAGARAVPVHTPTPPGGAVQLRRRPAEDQEAWYPRHGSVASSMPEAFDGPEELEEVMVPAPAAAAAISPVRDLAQLRGGSGTGGGLAGAACLNPALPSEAMAVLARRLPGKFPSPVGGVGFGRAERSMQGGRASAGRGMVCSVLGSPSPTDPRKCQSPRHRSSSAPREVAAEVRHVQRHSLGAAVTTGTKTSRPSSAPRDSRLPRHEALYSMGVAKQEMRRRMGNDDGADANALSLSESDWKRSSQRLHDDYRQKQERARSAREAAALSAEAMAAATAHGSASPDRAAFFARQEAVLARRAEAMARARPRDEEELAECTWQPEITQASKALRRSVNELHAWDARRMQRIQHAAATQEEHVCDGCTFQPVINSTSRTMALHLWESGPPDPQRPWTSAPMRGSLPAPRVLTSGGGRPHDQVQPHSPSHSQKQQEQQQQAMLQQWDALVAQAARNTTAAASSAAAPGPLAVKVAPGDGVAFVTLSTPRLNVSPGRPQALSPQPPEQMQPAGDAPVQLAHAALQPEQAQPQQDQQSSPLAKSLSGAWAEMLQTQAAAAEEPKAQAGSGGPGFSKATDNTAALLSKLGGTAHGLPGVPLQPTLSTATRAALELSNSHVHGASVAAALSAAAMQQPVQTFYVAANHAQLPAGSFSRLQIHGSEGKAAQEAPTALEVLLSMTADKQPPAQAAASAAYAAVDAAMSAACAAEHSGGAQLETDSCFLPLDTSLEPQSPASMQQLAQPFSRAQSIQAMRQTQRAASTSPQLPAPHQQVQSPLDQFLTPMPSSNAHMPLLGVEDGACGSHGDSGLVHGKPLAMPMESMARPYEFELSAVEGGQSRLGRQTGPIQQQDGNDEALLPLPSPGTSMAWHTERVEAALDVEAALHLQQEGVAGGRAGAAPPRPSQLLSVLRPAAGSPFLPPSGASSPGAGAASPGRSVAAMAGATGSASGGSRLSVAAPAEQQAPVADEPAVDVEALLFDHEIAPEIKAVQLANAFGRSVSVGSRAHEALVATLATLADAGIASQPPQQQYQSLRQRFGQQLQQEQQPTPAFVQANVRAGPIQQGASSGSEPGSPAARAPAHCKITAGASGPACPGSK